MNFLESIGTPLDSEESEGICVDSETSIGIPKGLTDLFVLVYANGIPVDCPVLVLTGGGGGAPGGQGLWKAPVLTGGWVRATRTSTSSKFIKRRYLMGPGPGPDPKTGLIN